MSTPQLPAGAEARLTFTVSDDDTAAAVGSGDLAVLGTPRLLAWCEAATCAAIADHLDAASTSVGTRVALEHRAASPVGAVVDVHATLVHVDGRLARFSVAAEHRVGDGPPVLVGTGEVTRVVVDAERFLARLG
ncbi:thioesterase family protein [Nocardioides massiliensis]|uniref:Thioesterase n=1 Tax=Nocardioides massiliensis TaxID=1325935 RepID=A0ABT9NTW6_9ACTN|nr:hotdog domain-containing protein [Nocardioides massiliensis]MDP9823871.1 putative thioesterase [Nocardioides massiliensis]